MLYAVDPAIDDVDSGLQCNGIVMYAGCATLDRIHPHFEHSEFIAGLLSEISKVVSKDFQMFNDQVFDVIGHGVTSCRGKVRL
jgi:hypothetical protein